MFGEFETAMETLAVFLFFFLYSQLSRRRPSLVLSLTGDGGLREKTTNLKAKTESINYKNVSATTLTHSLSGSELYWLVSRR